MADTENPVAPATEEKKAGSTTEVDLTKYKVGVNRNLKEKNNHRS
jgi:hypothetical protein